jgi:ATP-dependent RNA helicase RhlE
MTFAELGLSKPILDALQQSGYDSPSPIQLKAIPEVLAGHDLMAAAQTGTGKTAGFGLPLLQILGAGEKTKSNHIRALILTPTRELAAQVGESLQTYGANLNLTTEIVFGGVKINPQMTRLRRGADILVATPGRLLDLYQQRAVKFDQLEVFILDEADRMLDLGFIHDIKKIIAALPKQRQNLMFSATFSDDIRKLAKGLVNNPVEISVSPRNTAATTVKQWMCPVDKKQKPHLLLQLIKENQWQQALVFTRTKHGANKLTKFLDDRGIKAAAIHGNKSQAARTKALAAFKQGEVNFLIATDIAARGIDIDQLPQVVNFDLPQVAEDYVHRIGRTGRAGADGKAVSLVAADEFKQLSDIENLIRQIIERDIVPGFEPDHAVPQSQLRDKPKKPKKPKSHRTAANNKAANRNNTGGQPNGDKKRNSNRRSRTQGSDSSSKTSNQSDRPSQSQRRRKPKPAGARASADS